MMSNLEIFVISLFIKDDKEKAIFEAQKEQKREDKRRANEAKAESKKARMIEFEAKLGEAGLLETWKGDGQHKLPRGFWKQKDLKDCVESVRQHYQPQKKRKGPRKPVRESDGVVEDVGDASMPQIRSTRARAVKSRKLDNG